MLDKKQIRYLKGLDKKRRDAYTKAQDRDRQIALMMKALHIYSGVTYAELGEVFGVSRQRVHQIVKGVN